MTNYRNFEVGVKTINRHIYINGLSSGILKREMEKILGDRKFYNSVFEIHHGEIKFHVFYLFDVYYILSVILKNIKSKTLKSIIVKIMDLLEIKTDIKLLKSDIKKPLNYNKLKDFKYKPLDFQEDFYKYYSDNVLKYGLKGSLLAATPGSGKTFTTLSLARLLEVDKIVVICPLNSIRKTWEKEINNIYYKPPSYYLSVDKNKRYKDEHIAVYHYEALKTSLDDINLLLQNSSKIMVIIDESHNFNNISSIRSKLLLELVKKLNSTDIIFASGTPVKALGNELTVLFKAIDPSFDDEVIKSFTKIFGRDSSKGNLKLLQVKLGKLIFKVEKERLNLDEPNIIEVPIELPNGDDYILSTIKFKMMEFIEERIEYYNENEDFYREQFDLAIKEYRETIDKGDRLKIMALEEYLKDVAYIREQHDRRNLFSMSSVITKVNNFETTTIIPNLSKETRKIFKNAKSVVKYPLLKIKGEALGTILTKERIRCFRDLVDYIDFKEIIDTSEKKTIIFSSYISVCEKVAEVVKKLKYKPATVFGDKSKYLDKEVNDFNNKKTINPMVATYDSLSTAVHLTVANSVIFVNAPYRDYIRFQSISRVHRIGANTPIFIYDILLDTGDEPNLSSRGLDILKWSQEQIEAILGMETSSIKSNLNLTAIEDYIDLNLTSNLKPKLLW